jgi:cytochrome c oxidase cbb3-type subunit 4
VTYDTAAQFAQTWGLVFLFLLFLAAVGYALWPGNRSKFARAARLPLDETQAEPESVSAPGARDRDSTAIE